MEIADCGELSICITMYLQKSQLRSTNAHIINDPYRPSSNCWLCTLILWGISLTPRFSNFLSTPFSSRTVLHTPLSSLERSCLLTARTTRATSYCTMMLWIDGRACRSTVTPMHLCFVVIVKIRSRPTFGHRWACQVGYF